MGFGAGYGGGSFGDFCGVELVEVEGGEEIESGVRRKESKERCHPQRVALQKNARLEILLAGVLIFC